MSEDPIKFKSDKPAKNSVKKSRQDLEAQDVTKLNKEEIQQYKEAAKKFKKQFSKAIAFTIKKYREESSIPIKKFIEITDRTEEEIMEFESNKKDVDIIYIFDICSIVGKSLSNILKDISFIRTLEEHYECMMNPPKPNKIY